MFISDPRRSRLLRLALACAALGVTASCTLPSTADPMARSGAAPEPIGAAPEPIVAPSPSTDPAPATPTPPPSPAVTATPTTPAPPAPSIPAPPPPPAPAAKSTFPDAATTGVPDGTVLQPSGSVVVEDDGAVIEGLDVRGMITVKANNVTIRNTRISGSDDYLIRQYDSNSGLLVEDVEIAGQSGCQAGMGPFGNVTVRRADVHGCADGLRLEENTLVEDSFIHDLAGSQGSHNDGFQSTGKDNIVLRHNTIDNPKGQTSAILFGTEQGPSCGNVIENNYINGGGYAIYPGACGPQIINNHFGRDSQYGLLYFGGPAGRKEPIWLGNVWADTLEPVTP